MTKTIKKSSKNTNTKKTVKMSDNGSLFFASAVLFAGTCIVLLGAIQDYNNLKLVMVGFGSALLVVGGSLVGVATKTTK